MFLKFSVPRASNVLMLFLFLYRNIQKNARICMNWQFEAEIVLNLFLIFRYFEARCSCKIVLIKNCIVIDNDRKVGSFFGQV